MAGRVFNPANDLIDAMMKIMDTPEGFTGPVTAGNPGEFTMIELAQLVIWLTRARSRLVFRPLPQDDPRQRKPDIALARRELGWEPRVDLETGIGRTIEYFRELLAAL
jgi:UDP-glucuronate decarboxylase